MVDNVSSMHGHLRLGKIYEFQEVCFYDGMQTHGPADAAQHPLERDLSHRPLRVGEMGHSISHLVLRTAQMHADSSKAKQAC